MTMGPPAGGDARPARPALRRASFRIIAAAAFMVALASSCAPTAPAADEPPAPVPSSAAAPMAPAAPGSAPLAGLAPGMAILVEGSSPVKGLPGLGANALPGLAGAYAYLPAESLPGFPAGGSSESGAGPLRIEVWFTRVDIVVPPSWTVPACVTLPRGFSALASPAGPDGLSLWAVRTDEYVLMVAMPAGLASPCRFASTLADRFSFFHRYAERPEDVSFPAVLEL